VKEDTLGKLFGFRTLESGSDFFPSYLYLRHLHHFMYYVNTMLGMETVKPDDPLDETAEEMIKMYFRLIAETAPSLETNIYHGKVVKHSDARKLVSLDSPVSVTLPERVLPHKIAREVVLEAPPAMAVGRCPCRMSRKDPCVPPEEQEKCLIMGSPFAEFIADRNPHFRLTDRDEALSILEKSRVLGDVHSAYFKKEFGGRLMALCNCCRCCCMGMVMWNKLNGAVPFLVGSGYAAQPEEKCSECGICADKCPFYAIEKIDGGVKVNRAKCMGCGVCEGLCPEGSIRLVRDPSKCDPLDLDEFR
jgi:ferredoxin